MNAEPHQSDHRAQARCEGTASRPEVLAGLLLSEQPRYTARQVADRAGVDLEHATELWRSLGFAMPRAEEVMFTDADVDTLTMAGRLDATGASLKLPVAHALGHSIARMTEWQADLLHSLVLSGQPIHPSTSDDPEEPPTSLAGLLAVWERLQQHVWRRHLLAALERLITHPEAAGAETMTVVGFADIAGYTATSRGLTAARLAEFIEHFTTESSLVVTDRGGRVVKTIGDEIMFVIEDPAAAADIALTLAQRPSELDGRPELHIGLGYGPVLRHLGDYYGSVVNLASRLTTLARPGTVLIDQQLATALTGQPHLRTRRLAPVSLRGFPRLRPWLLRRAPNHRHQPHHRIPAHRVADDPAPSTTARQSDAPRRASEVTPAAPARATAPNPPQASRKTWRNL